MRWESLGTDREGGCPGWGCSVGLVGLWSQGVGIGTSISSSRSPCPWPRCPMWPQLGMAAPSLPALARASLKPNGEGCSGVERLEGTDASSPSPQPPPFFFSFSTHLSVRPSIR